MTINAHRSVHSIVSSIPNTYNPLTDKSNIVHCLSTTTSVIGIPVDDLSSHLSHSHPTAHLRRVAVVDYHDKEAWTKEWNVHDTRLNAVVASSSLGFNGTIPVDSSLGNVARRSFALMELQTERTRAQGQFPSTDWLREEAAVQAYNWTPLVTSNSGASPVRFGVTISPYPCGDLSRGRRRVGEILVRCGVIDVPGISTTESISVGRERNLSARPVDASVISGVTAELPISENRGILIQALANWTSEWVHTLVIQPYLLGNFRFQYRGKPSGVSTSVALRVRRILGHVENPVQVVIHALWLIGALTGNSTQDNAPFLSVPILRYLHNNGTFVAEDFMFRAFVACIMIADKTVNDATLSMNTWNRLTCIPQVILSATEKFALNCLKWSVVMTQVQWRDTIIYLRSCIKMSSAFDPFSYDGTSSSAMMARCLDELINLIHIQQEVPAVEIIAPQPIRHLTHWEVFNTAEWCPEDDPVINQKPRSIGVAPGANQNLDTLNAGTTAKDLLDSILGSSSVPHLAHLAQPAGTSFCGSFGVIGARLVHTVRIASACQSASWAPSHG